MQYNITRDLTVGEFRRLALEEAKRQLVFAIELEESKAAGGFVKRVPPPLLQTASLEELNREIAAIAQDFGIKYPLHEQLATATASLASTCLEVKEVADLLDAYRQLLQLYGIIHDNDRDIFSLVAVNDAVRVSATSIGDHKEGVPDPVLNSDYSDQALIAATVNLLVLSREKARALTQDERTAVLTAYALLDKGVQVPTSYRGIGVSGFRRHQTNLSVANPGEGHIRVTCSDSSLLAGTFVHIEHIDRGGERDREKLEPYRLPAAVTAARVRLHVGASAPCTAYIGRPVFESGDVERDLLKSVHMSASSCSAMFANGVADCKLGIERMTASQAIRFMRGVSGNVLRDPTRQYLSAAFNVNLSLVDDRAGSQLIVSDRYALARLGIEIAVEGGVEKVAWDGSSNQEPSIPIVEQLPYEQLLELVHIAHERGLETYISAGLQPHHMRLCTYLGVDGVGIGTSLHDFDQVSGLRGQLKAERIREVLYVRDAASVESLGRGAQMLAKLDRMYFEGTLPLALDSKRQQLYELMQGRRESLVAELLEVIGEVPGGAEGEDLPVIEQAKRVLNTAALDPVGLHRPGDWGGLVSSVRRLVDSRDVATLYEVLP
jgi:hypothetical protein